MTVAEIFTKGLEESAVPKPEDKDKKPVKKAMQTPNNTPAGTPDAQESTQQGVITVKAILDSPEIVLVSDSSKKDTNALVLKVCIVFVFHLWFLSIFFWFQPSTFLKQAW